VAPGAEQLEVAEVVAAAVAERDAVVNFEAAVGITCLCLSTK
jgi:hypothetical protein